MYCHTEILTSVCLLYVHWNVLRHWIWDISMSIPHYKKCTVTLNLQHRCVYSLLQEMYCGTKFGTAVCVFHTAGNVTDLQDIFPLNQHAWSKHAFLSVCHNTHLTPFKCCWILVLKNLYLGNASQEVSLKCPAFVFCLFIWKYIASNDYWLIFPSSFAIK